MASTVADDLWNVYKNEWKDARQSLSKEKHEEEVIYLLMRIVRGVYDECEKEAMKGGNVEKKQQQIAEDFIRHRLPLAIHKENVDKPLTAFIRRCVQCLLRLCSLNPAPYIHWIPKGDMIDKEKFDIEGDKSGAVCDWTVWPAVVLENGHTV
ncbi:hypothetical protein ACF0H5_010768 [Mactra antiquata]